MKFLIDTHVHLYSEEFGDDTHPMIGRALENGVNMLFMPNIDQTSIQPMLDLEERYPNNCFPMMGLHPCYVKENYKQELKIVENWLSKRSFIGIGEIGIDLYWDISTEKIQREAFIQQVKWAMQLKLPINIHTRESTDIVIDILYDLQDGTLEGIFHCFGGNLDQANRIIELGFSMGIGGVVTYKKSGLDLTLIDVPLTNLVLETDAPYLSPVPHRGKRNESAYLNLIAQKIAEIKKVDYEEVVKVTSQNALRLYKNIKLEDYDIK